MTPSRCCIQYVSKSGRLSSGHRTGKGRSSSHFPRRAVQKNVLTIRQLHSSPVLVRSCLKSCMLGFSICEPRTSRYSTWVCKSQRNQRSNCQYSLDHKESKRMPEKHLPLFHDYAKAFDCVDHIKQWKPLKEMGISDHLTCLLRNLYAGQEATVRTGCRKMDWLKTGKGIWQGFILSSCLFNLYADYIMWNPRLDESQDGIILLGEMSTTSHMQMVPL